MSDQAQEFTCHRCGSSTAPRLSYAPWPGELGKKLQAGVCANCWNDWVGVQTKIINEYRLNVLDPGHAKAVREQMELFLGFRQPDENQP